MDLSKWISKKYKTIFDLTKKPQAKTACGPFIDLILSMDEKLRIPLTITFQFLFRSPFRFPFQIP